MTERMMTEAHWGYYAFVLANLEVAEKGKLAVFDTANNGVLVNAKSAVGLVPIGIFAESMTGDGVKRIQVKLHRELQMTWWTNDSVAPVSANDRGQLCYLKDNVTVSADDTDRSVAGMVMDVHATKGVLVLFGIKTF